MNEVTSSDPITKKLLSEYQDQFALLDTDGTSYPFKYTAGANGYVDFQARVPSEKSYTLVCPDTIKLTDSANPLTVQGYQVFSGYEYVLYDNSPFKLDTVNTNGFRINYSEQLLAESVVPRVIEIPEGTPLAEVITDPKYGYVMQDSNGEMIPWVEVKANDGQTYKVEMQKTIEFYGMPPTLGPTIKTDANGNIIMQPDKAVQAIIYPKNNLSDPAKPLTPATDFPHWTKNEPAAEADIIVRIIPNTATERILTSAEEVAITVPYGSSETDAIAGLPTEIKVQDQNGYEVLTPVTWTVTGTYDGNTAGDYTFTGTLTLPTDPTPWVAADPVVTATATVTVEPEPVMANVMVAKYTDANITVMVADMSDPNDESKNPTTINVLGQLVPVNVGVFSDLTIIAAPANGTIDPNQINLYKNGSKVTLIDLFTDSTNGNYVIYEGHFIFFDTITADATFTWQPNVVKAIQAVDPVTVPNGTSETDAIAKLPTTVTVEDENRNTYALPVTWTINSYDGTTAGDYTATATVTLPDSLLNPNAVNLTVTTTVTVEAGSGTTPDPEIPAICNVNIQYLNFSETGFYVNKVEERVAPGVTDGAITKSKDGDFTVTGGNYLYVEISASYLSAKDFYNDLKVGLNGQNVTSLFKKVSTGYSTVYVIEVRITEDPTDITFNDENVPDEPAERVVKSVGSAAIRVPLGMTEAAALAKLGSSYSMIEVKDQYGIVATVPVQWTIDPAVAYDPFTVGDYKAIGTVTLPDGWKMPATELKVDGTITVVDQFDSFTVTVYPIPADVSTKLEVTAAIYDADGKPVSDLALSTPTNVAPNLTLGLDFSDFSISGVPVNEQLTMYVNGINRNDLMYKDSIFWFADIDVTEDIVVTFGPYVPQPAAKVIASAETVAPVTVPADTAEADAIAKLPTVVAIQDADGNPATAEVTWTVDPATPYDPTTPGTYKVVGTLTLPQGWTQAEPAINLTSSIIIEPATVEPGTIVLLDPATGIEVTIPADITDTNLELTVNELPGSIIDNISFVKNYQITLTREIYVNGQLVREELVTATDSPLQVRVPVPTGLDGGTVLLNNHKWYFIDDTAKASEYTHTVENGMICFTTTHFSSWGVGAPAASPTPGTTSASGTGTTPAPVTDKTPVSGSPIYFPGFPNLNRRIDRFASNRVPATVGTPVVSPVEKAPSAQQPAAAGDQKLDGAKVPAPVMLPKTGERVVFETTGFIALILAAAMLVLRRKMR